MSVATQKLKIKLSTKVIKICGTKKRRAVKLYEINVFQNIFYISMSASYNFLYFVVQKPKFFCIMYHTSNGAVRI